MPNTCIGNKGQLVLPAWPLCNAMQGQVPAFSKGRRGRLMSLLRACLGRTRYLLPDHALCCSCLPSAVGMGVGCPGGGHVVRASASATWGMREGRSPLASLFLGKRISRNTKKTAVLDEGAGNKPSKFTISCQPAGSNDT